MVAEPHRLARILHGHHDASAGESGALGIFRALEDDMATYVARNDLRERVRGFVRTLLLIVNRPDVAGVVLNTHSQGTMIGWDVSAGCRSLPGATVTIRARACWRSFVTAGSPIRKFVDMLAWGEQVGQLAALFDGAPGELEWRNFWDEHDPVADPLDPATAWRPGKALDERPAHDKGLLVATNPISGDRCHVHILDTHVDNIHDSSGGGLQAHDYWNNRSEFVAPLADVLRGLD